MNETKIWEDRIFSVVEKYVTYLNFKESLIQKLAGVPDSRILGEKALENMSPANRTLIKREKEAMKEVEFIITTLQSEFPFVRIIKEKEDVSGGWRWRFEKEGI